MPKLELEFKVKVEEIIKAKVVTYGTNTQIPLPKKYSGRKAVVLIVK